MKFSFTFVLQFVFAVFALSVAFVLREIPGLTGAAVALVMVMVFFGSTKVIIGPIATMSPAMSQPMALLFFLTKAGVLAALLVAMRGSEDLDEVFDFETLGVTLIVGSVLWIVGRTIDHARARVLTYDLPESDDPATDTMTE